MLDLSKQVFGGLPPGTVEIPQCGIYIKEESAAEPLFALLRKRGYQIEETERYGWFAKLRDDVLVRKGKCDHCGGLVEIRGIHAHGRDCELCGKPLCREYVDGGTIEFYFMSDDGMRSRISMKIKGFTPSEDDKNVGELVVYAEPSKQRRGFFTNPPERAKEILASHDSEIRRFEEDGVAFIGIPYVLHIVGVINTCEVTGREYHVRVVKLYDGNEYGDFLDPLPIPETITLKKAWEGYPLPRSPYLHEAIISAAGMVSRCDYYHQDGRRAFDDIHFLRMHIFVEHFTSLDVAEWDRMVERAPKSGPGFIRASAAFCQGTQNPVVKNEPNIGNLIIGFAKAFSGERLCDGEVDAMTLAASDSETRSDFVNMFKP